MIAGLNGMEATQLPEGHLQTLDTLLSEGERLLAEGSKNKVQALEQFKHATQVDPKSERAWLELAKTTDDVDEAIQALRQVVALNPGNIEARNRLSSLQVSNLREAMNANELTYQDNRARRYIIPVLLILDILLYGFLAATGGERALDWIRVIVK